MRLIREGRNGWLQRFAPAAALVMLAGAPGVGSAQEQTGATAAAPEPMQEVTVTATRREESLSKVPISVTALTQEALDDRGIKDFSEVARFTPGVTFDNSGTNNISIRGISGTGGAGTTGIYLDDTPIQMRALAFSPDEAVPKAFDLERVEVLRGPQGTLFGSGSEGGTVRYITTPPSLSKTTISARSEVATTEGGDTSYEAGVALGGPLIQGTLGARLALWYRRDGGYVDRADPYQCPVGGNCVIAERNANFDDNYMLRGALLWAPSEHWSITPAIYYQDRKRNDIGNYWPLYSNPGSENFVNANPTPHPSPDRWYLPSLKIEGDLGTGVRLISNTSFFHRQNQTGYDGTLYNLGYYQTQNASPIFLAPWADGTDFVNGIGTPLLDGNGLHVPGGLQYRAPATINNGQENITQEIRLQSTDPNAKLLWTGGVFFTDNRQTYLEQIHDPQLNDLTNAVLGVNYTEVFCVSFDPVTGLCTHPFTYVAGFPFDSYFLKTSSKDQQIAGFGEATYAFTDSLKLTVGARWSRMKYTFDTLTGGPQLYADPRTGTGDITENAFTPKVSLQFQADPADMYYATYAKGFRPGGANNPIPNAACPTDFANFGIATDPPTFSSDSVQSFELGAKNNFSNRVRLASSIYYIRWSNIQQLVVPPVCQISFIANTGNAVAKGADIQAEISVASGLSLELAAGYTQARFTENFSFSQSGLDPRPLVADGDAIVGPSSEAGGGQPAAPFTASAGVEYRFNVVQHEAFVRLDAEYEARAKWNTPGLDPGTSQSDPAAFVLPATTFVSLRGGMHFGPWEVHGFVDNLTNTHALTDYNNSICGNPGADPAVACHANAPDASRLQRDYTFRPRTLGITVLFRQ